MAPRESSNRLDIPKRPWSVSTGDQSLAGTRLLLHAPIATKTTMVSMCGARLQACRVDVRNFRRYRAATTGSVRNPPRSYDNGRVNGVGAPQVNLTRSGAIQGVLCMMAYWVVESFFLYILPWLREPDFQYTSMHTGFTAIVLGFYIVAGLIVGAAAGKLAAVWAAKRPRANDPEPSTRIGVMLTVLLCFALAILLYYRVNPALPPWYLPAIFFPVGVSLLTSLFSKPWSKRLALLSTPWAATIFLLATPFIFDVPDPKPTLLSGTISFASYAIAALLLSLLMPLRRVRTRSILAMASVTALMLAACFLLHQSPRRSSPRTSAMLAGNTPNIILITLDTVRADHLSLFGYERDTTPNLKRLAQEATLYANAISPGNMTLSSH